MSVFDFDRLRAAYHQARNDLLSKLTADGHWVGRLASSALSTATAVSALQLARNAGDGKQDAAKLDRLIQNGLNWIIDRQNADGGWGDTDKSYSNISTTMLVVAATHLANRADEFQSALARAETYIEQKGGVDGLRRRYGRDKTFAVPILTNCALAGIADWKEISPLPFEAACVPQKFYRFLQLPVVSYAIPALVAIGQAHYFNRKPWNPIARVVRSLSINPSLRVLERMQPQSGGYLEAIPLTSFVVMALAGTGRATHPVTENGVRFLMSSVQEDGSWPIDTNLATWNTTLSMNALGSAGEDLVELLPQASLDWLLDCQYQQVHPFTGAEPGGWGWSNLSGAVPDCDDTPGALLALAHWKNSPNCRDEDRQRISHAMKNGINWIKNLQNRNGGWPTFCRGWGKLPFDRSGTDLSAHAMRAILACTEDSAGDQVAQQSEVQRGFRYIEQQQRADGSWTPLWFGNQDYQEEENPIYGTSKVLLAYRDFGKTETEVMRRGLSWLDAAQNSDGGWGGGAGMVDAGRDPSLQDGATPKNDGPSSVEETALAVEALASAGGHSASQTTIDKGVEWLCWRVENNLHQECSPIGFYFAKLWYYEDLYPLIFTVSALGQALKQSLPPTQPAADRHLEV